MPAAAPRFATWTRPARSAPSGAPRSSSAASWTCRSRGQATARCSRERSPARRCGTWLPRELERCDLEEVLLQTAVYAGVPAANTGFHLAGEERDGLAK